MELCTNRIVCIAEQKRARKLKRIQRKLRRKLDACRCQPICWAFVLPVIFRLKPLDVYFNWEIIKFILGLFDAYKCNNKQIISDVLYFAYVLIGNYPRPRDTEYLDNLFTPVNCFSVQNKRKFFHLMELPYAYAFACDSIYNDVTFLLVKNGKEELLSTFFRHGIAYLPLDVSCLSEMIERLKVRA